VQYLTGVHKELLSALAIALTFIAFVPYLRSVQTGRTKPHIFSWIIWGLATLIIFLAQLADGGGAGAWPIGVSAIASFYVAVLAYARGADRSITRTDWVFFISALATIPLWILTSDPLSAVIILTVIDVLGFGPTFRKTYIRPHEERITLFAIVGARNLISIAALEHYSLTTVLFPAVLAAICLIFISMVFLRRRSLV
jgi:hypothetical protein